MSEDEKRTLSEETIDEEGADAAAAESRSMEEAEGSVDAVLAAFEADDAERRIRARVEADPGLVKAKAPGGVPLPLAALYHGREDVADLLLDLGAPLDVHTAAALGREKDLDHMLGRRRASVRALSADGWTPLHLAAYFGRREAAARLIDRGADVGARSENTMENTPLHAAAAGGRMACVMLLVERGADVNAEAAGIAPLDIACGRRDDEMVRYLVDRGARKARKGGKG